MFVRSALLLAAFAVSALPSAASACGMPHRGDGDLLVQLKAIETPPALGVATAEEEDNRYKLEISDERSALAESVAKRLAEAAEVTPAKPKS